MKGKIMKFKVTEASRGLMPDIYDEDVDRDMIRVKFEDGQHTIIVKYMAMTTFTVATQLTYGGKDFWGAEVIYMGYRSQPCFSSEKWREFDKAAQEYIDTNGIA
jgi:hypothetical protein